MAGAKGKSGGSREGAGRSTFKPTDEQRRIVSSLSSFGIRIDEMPVFILGQSGQPISETTLKKYFKHEIEHGRLKANYKVANQLYKNATEPTEKSPFGQIAAQIFWLKAQAGWKETAQKHEHTGADGKDLIPKSQILNIPNNATPAQIAALAAALGATGEGYDPTP